MFSLLNKYQTGPLYDSALTVNWHLDEPTGSYINVNPYPLPRVESIDRKEVKCLAEDIHKIIESARRDWEEAKWIELQENMCSQIDQLPIIEPYSIREVKIKIISKEEGTISLNFLEDYKHLFD